MTDVGTPRGYAFDVHRCLFAEYLCGRGEQEFCQRSCVPRITGWPKAAARYWCARAHSPVAPTGATSITCRALDGRWAARRTDREHVPPPVADRQPGRF